MSKLTSINPYNGQIVFEKEKDTPEVVTQKLATINKNQAYWAELKVAERAVYLNKLSQIMKNKLDELARSVSLEMGMPITQAKQEVSKSISIIDHYSKEAQEILKPTVVTETGFSHSAIYYHPLGTVLHISPWNYPFYLALRPVIPALISGNTVILKMPSNTPLCAQKMEECILETGLDPYLQVVYISGGETSTLIADNSVSMVTLIGSTGAGSKVASLAGKHLKKTVMELGGSDPMIIMEGADIDKVVAGIVVSRLRNAGQSCNAAKRILVHKNHFQELSDKLANLVNQEIVGDPLDSETTTGPLADKKSQAEVLAQINDSVQAGAKILATIDNHNLQNPKYIENQNQACFVLPVVIHVTDPSVRVWKEEVFGPVLPIMTFESIEEAIELANDTEYGLGASIWCDSSQYTEVLDKIMPKIQAGNVYLNSPVRGNLLLPFGGVKKSGYGREFGEAGIKEFVNIKTVAVS